MTTAEALYLYPPQPPAPASEAKMPPVLAGMSTPPIASAAPDGAPWIAPRALGASGWERRQSVPDTRYPPWSLVCHLLVQDARGRVRTGTGWLAGPSTVFTAGHTLWDPAEDHAAQRVWIVPGRQALDATPFGSWMAPAFDAHPLWRSAQRPDADIGVVWLPQPLGRRLGCFGFAVHTDTALRELEVWASGYPDGHAQGTQWHTRGRIHELGPRTLACGLGSLPEHSGSPVFVNDDHGLPVAVGMHVHGSGTAGHALRFTRAHFELLKIWRK